MDSRQMKSWLNRDEYPFESNYFDLPMGRMHYVDEGRGEPVVFVHGNPGWSFEYRKCIGELSKTHRCIAGDHIGFGLSDKPFDWDYLPKNHAENFARFLDHLGLEGMILVVNDWGGPIGLSYALDNPGKIRHLVITNTWMWSAADDLYYRFFSGFAGGPLGRFLIRNFNFFGRVIIRKCFADLKNFNPAIYRHLETANDRKGCWTFPKQIIASSGWLDSLWRRKKKLLGIPATVIWGTRDIAFREKEFRIWDEALPDKKVIKLENAGHYPHEEAAETVIEAIKSASAGRETAG